MAKKKIKFILCDSNVLFSLLRGDEKTRINLQKIGDHQIAFSIITVAEAYAGCSKLEFTLLKKVFSAYKVFLINDDVSKIFHGLMQSHHSRHSKWIPDALIAATAISNNLELYTYNKKDFDFIDDLILYRP